ncbi:WAT1-related protein [Actinidia chinensis var. chinensis]|uniref:WAT1-related protein n=1 Tax=Actinidia chinensis var. chinensis TaxID=1590841 RepID=A0A2R6Q5N0_ACTCC|nr:WAT1-related protein [Actinidia chinensis var. chinensis]
MENLDMRSSRSQINIIGTLVSISEALIVTLYKGSPTGFLPIPSPSSPYEDSLTSQPSLLAMESNWVLGRPGNEFVELVWDHGQIMMQAVADTKILLKRAKLYDFQKHY